MNSDRFLTNWIWTPEWTFTDNERPQFVYFRKEIEQDTVDGCRIKISADSRYKLYVNGVFVQEGPSKGDKQTWFYDEADLTQYLKSGRNTVAIIVLRYPEAIDSRNHSLLRTEMPCLYIEDVGTSDNTEVRPLLGGKAGWKCSRALHVTLMAEPARPAPLHILENVKGNKEYMGWMQNGFDDSGWQDTKPYSFFAINQTVSPANLVKRTIPKQRHKEGRLKSVVCIREADGIISGNDVPKQWEKLIRAEGSAVISPNTSVHIELDANELMTGYFRFACVGGKGSKVTIHYAESYAYPENKNERSAVPKKGDRTDYVNGRLCGFEDYYTVGGWGSQTQMETYETFWFRTFRFIGLTIETSEEPLEITDCCYIETGYPLDVVTHVETSDPTLEAIWDISERTLRRCMHETYMDCPFYEQLQYAMDSRAEILYTYSVSADDRLARKCMEDFRRSQRYDGMITCSAPSARSNVIPGFSIYYILMVHDHMMYFGNKELIKTHFPAIESILNYFEQRISGKGLPENLGGPYMRHPYWSFIDWTEQWAATSGVPTAILQGPITIESLLYIMGLQHAGNLAEYLGRNCIAEEYRMRAEKVKAAIRKYCIGKNGLIQDGPGVEEYGVHCQVFGVLTDVLEKEEGKKILDQVVGKPEYTQCSVAMSFYLFRALEKADLYAKINEQWDLWRKMVQNNMTTCVENMTDERSDCHAWGSVILYELPAVTLGVRPAAPGYEKVFINPKPGYLEYAAGDVITPKGMIHVEWSKGKDGQLKVNYQLPEGITMDIVR